MPRVVWKCPGCHRKYAVPSINGLTLCPSCTFPAEKKTDDLRLKGNEAHFRWTLIGLKFVLAPSWLIAMGLLLTFAFYDRFTNLVISTLLTLPMIGCSVAASIEAIRDQRIPGIQKTFVIVTAGFIALASMSFQVRTFSVADAMINERTWPKPTAAEISAMSVSSGIFAAGILIVPYAFVLALAKFILGKKED